MQSISIIYIIIIIILILVCIFFLPYILTLLITFFVLLIHIFRIIFNILKDLLTKPNLLFKTIFCFLLCLYGSFILISSFDIFVGFPDKDFKFKIEVIDFAINNFNNDFIDFITPLPLKNTTLSKNMRKNLFKKYRKISSQFNSHDYSSIAFFCFLNEGYNYSDKDEYYNMYIQEAERILENFKEVGNIDHPQFIKTYVRSYAYKSRIEYYLYLLAIYENYLQNNYSIENFNKITKFYNEFENIKEQDLKNPQLKYINQEKFIKNIYSSKLYIFLMDKNVIRRN